MVDHRFKENFNKFFLYFILQGIGARLRDHTPAISTNDFTVEIVKTTRKNELLTLALFALIGYC